MDNDIAGQRFGRLTALRKSESEKSTVRHPRWVFRCDCGKEKDIDLGSVRVGRSQSCGCLRDERSGKGLPKVDLTGKVFGFLTVIKFVGVSGRRTEWLCVCKCGNETIRAASLMLKGGTTSCGCKVHLPTQSSKFRHGKSGERVYNIWCAMRQRCGNPKSRFYSRYGGRGIKVCARWEYFDNFYADMGDPPDGLTIDRIDNDGDYCPSNCRWGTRMEQARNRSSSREVSIGGVTKTLAEWAEISSIKYSTINWRIKRGWPESRWLDSAAA